MYSNEISEYLTPMFFKDEKHNLLPDLKVIGLDQKCFVDRNKKLEIRNIYGLGSSYICDYLFKSNQNELTLIEKTRLAEELFSELSARELKEKIQLLLPEIRSKLFETLNLVSKMYLRKDIDIDFETINKFILVIDNNNIDFSLHQQLVSVLDYELNLHFGGVTGTINKVTFADDMIIHYKKYLLEKGLK